MFVDLFIALSCGLTGLLCGWFVYPTVCKPQESQAGISSNEEQIRLAEIATRLSLLTQGVAAHVDHHQSILQTINSAVSDFETSNDPSTFINTMTRILDASEMMRDQLAETQRKLDQQNALLQTAEEQSLTDALTQLANRRAFDAYVNDRIQLAATQPATMMMMDIDHFKALNDSFGHIAGDAVLRTVAEHLEARLGSHGMVARFGGEEFIAIFDNMTLAQCVELAESVRVEIGHLIIKVDQREIRVTASIGLADLPSEFAKQSSTLQLPANHLAQQWIKRADQMLYESKRFRNCGHAMITGKPVRIGTSPATSKRQPLTEKTEKLLNPKDLPRTMRGLPTGEQMRNEFAELAAGTDGAGHAFVAAVVRIDAPMPRNNDLGLACKTIRSVVRSVDRIGILDHRTLVVAMPNIDHETAVLKADRMRAGMMFARQGDLEPNSAESDRSSELTVSVSLCSDRERSGFDKILNDAVRRLEHAKGTGTNRTYMAW